MLLFQSPYISYYSIFIPISNILDKIKNVTVKHSSIIKSVKKYITWSLYQHNSFIMCGDILFQIFTTAYISCFMTKLM